MIKKQFSIFGYHLKNEFAELNVSNFIYQLAGNLGGFFIPIYIYQKSSLGLLGVVLYYLGLRVLVMISSLLAGELISRFNLRLSMFVGGVLYLGFFVSLILMPQSVYFLFLVIIFRGLELGFTWVGKNTDISLSLDNINMAGDLAKFDTVTTMICLISPVIAGVMIFNFGYEFLYIVSLGLAVIHLVSIVVLGEKEVEYEFPSFEVCKKAIVRFKDTSIGKLNFLEGVRGFMSGGVWPIWLMIVLSDVQKIGWLVTGVGILIGVVNIFLGRFVDRHPEKMKKMIGFGMSSEGMIWIGKMFAFDFTTLFVMDIVNKVGTAMVGNNTGKLSFHHERAKRDSLEHVIERELLLSSGFVFMALVLAIVSLFWGDLETLKISLFAFCGVMIVFGVGFLGVKRLSR